MKENHFSKLILASTSPYRAALLKRLGLPFEVVAPQVVEDSVEHETPSDAAVRLAVAKATAVATLHPSAIVIGSDQIGVCAGRVLGKPYTVENAIEQLYSLSGNSAEFHTAVAVFNPTSRQMSSACVPTQLQARNFSRNDARRYVELEQPLNCAGSFKAESLGIALFDKISSDDPTALIGLPLIMLARMLRACQVDPLSS